MKSIKKYYQSSEEENLEHIKRWKKEGDREKGAGAENNWFSVTICLSQNVSLTETDEGRKQSVREVKWEKIYYN